MVGQVLSDYASSAAPPGDKISANSEHRTSACGVHKHDLAANRRLRSPATEIVHPTASGLCDYLAYFDALERDSLSEVAWHSFARLAGGILAVEECD